MKKPFVAVYMRVGSEEQIKESIYDGANHFMEDEVTSDDETPNESEVFIPSM